jgi:hypothetical protein
MVVQWYEFINKKSGVELVKLKLGGVGASHVPYKIIHNSTYHHWGWFWLENKITEIIQE